MQIKQQMLAQHIQKEIAPLYVLIGEDNYLLEESLTLLKSIIKKKYDCEEKIFSIQTAEDWRIIYNEANSYSLFSNTTLLNIFFDKKTIDAVGKKIINDYLNSINSRCFIIIRAPNVPAKQLQWLNTQKQAVVSIAYPLNSTAIKNWIVNQLKKYSLDFAPQVPELIHQYTQGNMLACAQVIEKIALSNAKNSLINLEQVQEHLSNQCEHNLFELSEACLLGQASQAIQILRHTANNKTEATLVLWILTQEVRLLNQLIYLRQKIDFNTACTQLKIWSQKINLYQTACNRLNTRTIQQLHHYCYNIDEHIKTNNTTQIWNALENLALSLCLGHLVGDICTI